MSESEPFSTIDIEELSLRGAVAFAARCAQRLRPLYGYANPEYVDSINKAMTIAANFAAGINIEGSVDDEIHLVSDAAIDTPSTNAIRAIAYAAAAAEAANADRIEDAYNYAYNVLHVYKTSFLGISDQEPLADYHYLLLLGHDPRPAIGDPIDLNSLGSLWPNGEPYWYREAVESQKIFAAEVTTKIRADGQLSVDSLQRQYDEAEPAPIFDIYWEDDRITEEDIAAVTEYLACLHREQGGSGLKPIDGNSQLPAQEFAGGES